MPLRKLSGLTEPALAGKILALSEGVLGEIVAVVTCAAATTVLSGTEAISPRVIEISGFMPPSGRRPVAI
ncbi:hypothetical protein [Bradyrhizobium sp. ERR14]|uniref:hypothetical protein n=1 Tax=Bradyrhizobium sp. ERR14 TaxID=2663837 RepID=UPI00184E3EC0|nr:hypothetical protein [Bradyrhizobium sp. ERR14]MBB4396614.1 hypothetical protein [Bradyrhizobium sp. ERR14]